MVRKLSKTFKITSRFYVIYGDYDPIYVGYTNRTVRQRFREHKEDKDFSDYDNIEVKELVDEKLSFDFTWDYDQTCRNADKVSLREGQLVQKYGTQDSIFQKADGGGQTWASEKWFVKSNRDNPRFTNMSGEEIKARIEKEKSISADIYSFVKHISYQYQADVSNFSKQITPEYQIDVYVFVRDMSYQYQSDISAFVRNICSIYQSGISHFVSNMLLKHQVDIKNFVNNMNIKYKSDISVFVSSMSPQYRIDVTNFVNDMKYQYLVDISHFVSHMCYQYQADIHNFVNNMKRRK